MNKVLLLALFLGSNFLSFGQNFEQAFDILDDRLKAIEAETNKLTEENLALSQNLAGIQRKLSREKKKSKQLEKQLDEALTKLYDNQNALRLKILEADLLRTNIDLLQQDNKNLSNQVTMLDSSKAHLMQELHLNKLKIHEMDSLHGAELKRARNRSVITSLKYPLGRPNPNKTLMTINYDLWADLGARVSIERKRIQFGIAAGYSNFNDRIPGYSDYFSFINAGFNVKCFKGFRESFQDVLGANANQFINFELGAVPYSFNRNKIANKINGNLYAHFGLGIAFPWDKNKIIAFSAGWKMLNYSVKVSSDVKENKVALRGFCRMEFTFW